jgi:hypothetical protein
MKQKQVDYNSIETDASAHIDKTQAQVSRATLLPLLDNTLPLARKRWRTQQRSRMAARRQRLLDALEAIATDTPTVEQAWEVLWNDTEQRAFYNVHYRTRIQHGTTNCKLHTVPGIANKQEREDLTCRTLETLFRNFPRWRALPPNGRLAWYFRQQRWQHVSWYRRIRMDSNRGAGQRHSVGEATAVPEDMHAAALALCATSAVAERPQPLRLESAGTASAARVSALLLPLAPVPSAAPPFQTKTGGSPPLTPYETRDLVIDAVTLLMALSTATEGSQALRQGSTALLRHCAEECTGGALGQPGSFAQQAQDLALSASTLRGYVYTIRLYLKAQLDLR